MPSQGQGQRIMFFFLNVELRSLCCRLAFRVQRRSRVGLPPLMLLVRLSVSRAPLTGEDVFFRGFLGDLQS